MVLSKGHANHIVAKFQKGKTGKDHASYPNWSHLLMNIIKTFVNIIKTVVIRWVKYS